MPRMHRVTPGGMVFHVINRGVGRMRLFQRDADYAAFEAILEETLDSRPMRICAYCVMPNHWHLVLWPKGDGDLAAFMQRLTITHVTRWQKHRGQISTRAATSALPSRATSISIRWFGTWSGTRCVPTWCIRQISGVGPVCGVA